MRALLNNSSFLVIFFGLALGCGIASGKDIYIANASAGSQNGQSCANAYAVTFFNTASNWGSGTNQIGPGTTVHLCGTLTGAANASLLTFQGNGSSGNPITLYFEPGANLTSPVWGGAIIANNRSYIIIDGGTPCGATQGGKASSTACNGTIQNTANGTGLTYQQGSNFISAYTCTNCEIRNLALINNYIHKQCDTSSGCDSAAGTTENSAILFSGSNFNIHDNLIHDCSWCVNDQANAGDTNLSLHNNNVYNSGHGYAIYGGTTWPGPVLIYNNYIHDYQAWDTGSADVYHEDGIHAFGMNLASIYIYNNTFSTSSQCCITGEVFLEGGTTWTNSGHFYVFNNIFAQPSGSANLVQPYLGQPGSLVVNNTIVGSSPGAGWSLQTSGTDIQENNNIIAAFGILVDTANTTFANASAMDYNAYADCTSYNCFWGGSVDSGSFSTWVSGAGYDTHSTYTSTLSGLGLTASYAPTSASSMIIGKGTNLTSLCSGNLSALCSDINGNPRPTSGPWDIGAYVFASGSLSLPAAPTAITATVQ